MRPPRDLKPIGRKSQRPARKLVSATQDTAVPLDAQAQPVRKRRSNMRLGLRALLALCGLVVLTLAGFRTAALMRETNSAEAIAPASGQFVDTGHGRMFVQDGGPRDRTPIVLVHGTAAWSEFWRGTIDHLRARGHRVVALDLPPFGFSDRSAAGAYTRADQAKRITGALDALKIDRAIFVGHSFGAGATVETVMLHPDRIAGLVLVAAALGLPEDGASPEASPGAADRILRLPVLPEMLVAATLTNPLMTRRLLAMMMARKDAATDELADILRRPMTRRNSTPDFVVWARGFLAPDLGATSMSPPRYAQISAPTRILWGNADTVTPLRQGERLAGLIRGSKLEVLAGVGHMPQIEDPGAFRAALDKALAEMPLTAKTAAVQ